MAPRRSLVFMTVSGEEKGLLGSQWYSENPIFPLEQTVANLNMDMVVVDDQWPDENFYFRSDHYNFARKGVPILFFFTGTHDDYHRPSDHPDRILYEKTSRITQLIYYLGLDIAEASGRPEWDPEAYRRVVEDGGDN